MVQAALTRLDIRPAGRKIENVVPERPGFTILLNRIVPPYFFTIPSELNVFGFSALVSGVNPVDVQRRVPATNPVAI